MLTFISTFLFNHGGELVVGLLVAVIGLVGTNIVRALKKLTEIPGTIKLLSDKFVQWHEDVEFRLQHMSKELSEVKSDVKFLQRAHIKEGVLAEMKENLD